MEIEELFLQRHLVHQLYKNRYWSILSMHVERHAFTTFAARTPGGSLTFIQLKLGVEAVTPSWAKESRPRPRNTKDFIVGFVGFAITRIFKTKHLKKKMEFRLGPIKPLSTTR